jgi:ABC-2 type transport system ATP-binding protein
MAGTSVPDVIVARGLAKRFADTAALDGVDLRVARGEVFGVIGPNAAGKTTLIQILATLVDPSAGGVSVLGYDTVREVVAVRRRIGYVSQEFTLYGSLSVDENLDFFADLYGVPRAARDARKQGLLAWSRLEPFRARRAGRLSGGMQKKLHLCCTLIHEPEILFLDEPTTGVDPVARRELWEILRGLVAGGLTLVVATPYMDEADQCDRVALMSRGRILRCDTPDALRDGVAVAVWELRGLALPQVRDRLGASAPSLRVQLIGDRLHIVAPATVDVEAELRAVLPGEDGGSLQLRRVEPTMEDVFVCSVGGGTGPRIPGPVLGPPGGRHRPRPAAPTVRVDGLTRRFGDFTAVDRISLTVEPGEVFGFLGPNGSGKTTTIRMLCGLLPPSGGRGEVLGGDIVRRARGIRSRIGYVSQRFSLYNDLTVGENLRFFGAGYGLARGRLAERTTWVLDMAGLRGEERKLAGSLSGGVKQRLALGCAILHEPEILFLDEPTAGVDPVARRELWDLIGALSAAGTTVFVSTHYLDEAEYCQRLGLMYRGRLIAEGSPRALRDGMRAGTMLEVACVDPLRAVRLLRARRAGRWVSLSGRRVHVVVDDVAAGAQAVREALRADGLRVTAVEAVPFSLEDLFTIFIEMEERGREGARA